MCAFFTGCQRQDEDMSTELHQRLFLASSGRQACREQSCLVTQTVDIALVVLSSEVDGH
jgi:hypothetical protein